jgi:predicted nucleotidyltransferase
MWLCQPLDDVLSSGTKVAILRMLCSRPGPWSGREIARETGLSSSNCARALRDLSAAMVVEAQPVGNAIAYSLTGADTPLVQRLRDLFDEERRRHEQLVNALAERIPRFVSLILFGSEARRAARATSDVDLLILVEEQTERLAAEIDDICLQESLAQLLQGSWIIGDLTDVSRWQAEGNTFWEHVLRDGIALAGWPLERLRQHGHMADARAGGAGLLGRC